jgi:predicted RNA-binding protein with PUA-like domain
MALVRIGRLSVQPVTEKEWDVVLELAGEKK